MIVRHVSGVMLYSEKDFADLPRLAVAVLRELGFDHASSVYRNSEESNHPLPPPDSLTMQGLPGFEFVDDNVPADELAMHYRAGEKLLIWLPHSPALVTPFAQAVEEVIPPDVRGSCCVFPEDFTIGRYYAYARDASGRKFFEAWPTFCCGFYPREDPLQPARYAEMIFRVPAMIEFKRRLEGVVGPLREFAYWPEE
jgi:hypothetical protein